MICLMKVGKGSFVWFSLLTMMFLSCNHKEKQMQGYIAKMQETPVCVPLDKLDCVLNQEKMPIRLADSSNLRLVIYADFIVCSSCRIKEMYKWDDFLSKLDIRSNQMEVLFIFAPSHDKIGQFKMAAKALPENYPIYMDTTNIFLKSNPHIPSNPIFHTFLLDENNNVLLVGNPLENEKIEELFWEIVEERLGKRK